MTTGQHFVITESSPARLPLTNAQAKALRRLGKQLIPAQAAVDDSEKKTAIHCTTTDGDSWRVRIDNAVGAIGLPDGVRISVQPKIPTEHLMYLLRIGRGLPRSAASPADFARSDDFQDLVADWFLTSLENLLRGGLRRAYVEREEALPTIRGRLDLRRTAMNLVRGSIQLHCSFEDFVEDTALNRVLAAATLRIARSRLMPRNLRRRARLAATEFRDVGRLHPSDMRVEPDRITNRYSEPLSLAKIILADSGVGLRLGTDRGTSFLIPTPNVVEAALRQLVAEALHDHTSVTKGRKILEGASMTVNPDLDFASRAVGDIKYKVWGGSWIRSDLYQLVAFAAAYRRTHALHVGFGGEPTTKTVAVGDTKLSRVTWNDDDSVTPENAAAAFKLQVVGWWERIVAAMDQEELPPEKTAQQKHSTSSADTS